MNASWYDLLDVAPDAPEAEIKAAWKGSIADLDPTDRKFGVYNAAAEVLLDPRRRKAYDAELATARAEDKARDSVLSAGPSAGPSVAPGVASAAASTRGVPAWLLAGLALLTAVAVGACVWVVTTRASDAAVRESTRAAQSAAERAIGPVLSYDFRRLEESQQAADSYLTPGYRKEYDRLFELVKQNAPQTRTVVSTEVVDSGVIRSGEDRVDVLLFVDRPTTNKQNTEPLVYKDQATARMEKVGDDWLVDCVLTSGTDDCG